MSERYHPNLSPQALGYWFEDKTRDKLKEIQETKPSAFHRFTDSKAAKTIVAAQPGDHMLLIPNKAVLIEEKASTKHESFRSCLTMIENKQIAFHRIWHRAGHPSLVLFYSDLTDKIEIWDGTLVAKHRVEGKRMRINDNPIAICDLRTLTDTLYSSCATL